MQQETQTNEHAMNAIGQYLNLTEEQQEKLVQLNNDEAALPAAPLAGIIIDAETDRNGYLHYERSVTTVVPIRFTAKCKVLEPTTGSWDLSVYLNGKRIFHESNVQYGHEYSVSGRTGWGTSKVEIKAQWSESRYTRVKVQVAI